MSTGDWAEQVRKRSREASEKEIKRVQRETREPEAQRNASEDEFETPKMSSRHLGEAFGLSPG
jgi:hypothetical protein